MCNEVFPFFITIGFPFILKFRTNSEFPGLVSKEDNNLSPLNFVAWKVGAMVVSLKRVKKPIIFSAILLSSELTLRLLMSYIYGVPSKARNANIVYIWTYVWQR